MAIVLCDNSIFVHQFDYKMDGSTTGTLFLLASPRRDRLIAFETTRVCLMTPWHGSWSGYEPARKAMSQHPEQLRLNFDFRGRPDKAAFKWAHVAYRPAWGEYQGDDYMNRRIQMKRTMTWRFEH